MLLDSLRAELRNWSEGGTQLAALLCRFAPFFKLDAAASSAAFLELFGADVAGLGAATAPGFALTPSLAPSLAASLTASAFVLPAPSLPFRSTFPGLPFSFSPAAPAAGALAVVGEGLVGVLAAADSGPPAEMGLISFSLSVEGEGGRLDKDAFDGEAVKGRLRSLGGPSLAITIPAAIAAARSASMRAFWRRLSRMRVTPPRATA